MDSSVDEHFDEDANDVDVVVVGGGLTGLTAAYEILRRRAGLQVLVIEGKDAAGGRILPADYSDALHAHPLQEHVSRLLRTLRIATHPRLPIGRNERTVFAGGRPLTSLPAFHAAQANHFLRTIQAVTAVTAVTSEAYEDREDASTSAAHLLARLVFFSRPRSVCGAIVRSTCGTDDLEETSALWLLDVLRGAGGLFDRLRATVGDEERYFVRGGMRRIVEELEGSIILNGGAIKFGEPITKIQFNDVRAYVFTGENRIKCEHVVIAVPPPESSGIVVEPQPPGRLRDTLGAFNRGGESAFFIATYERRFWSEDRGRSGDVLAAPASGTAVRFVYDATVSRDNQAQSPRLAGLHAERGSPTSAVLQLFDTLRRCFESEEAHRWLRFDETARAGSPMNVPRPHRRTTQGPSQGPARAERPDDAGPPLSHGRLFFAASEHAASWPGTADGAIESGTNAARLILALSRPQTLARTGTFGANGRRPRRNRLDRSGSGGTLRATLLHRAFLGVHVLLLLNFVRAGRPR